MDTPPLPCTLPAHSNYLLFNAQSENFDERRSANIEGQHTSTGTASICCAQIGNIIGVSCKTGPSVLVDAIRPPDAFKNQDNSQMEI